ncbi:nucleophile aminohydrolase [Phellopilus nigrolimitatus]|nr:nucleophile aminohydrolase [Phellopilus nigrolimitatus]
MCTDNSPWLVAVHGGAGYHSTNPASEKAVKHALRAACIAAFHSLKGSNAGAVDAVEHTICSLENAECLNAGKGSNLTFDGEVECDASIMDGEAQHFGSVGAVQGVKNPIAVARAVMDNSKRPQPLGRIPPLSVQFPILKVCSDCFGFTCPRRVCYKDPCRARRAFDRANVRVGDRRPQRSDHRRRKARVARVESASS